MVVRSGREPRRDDLVYLTISTGIGGGSSSTAGCTGARRAMPASSATSRSTTTEALRLRSRGCLEAYASGTNIAARAREAIAAGAASSLLGDLPRSPRGTSRRRCGGDPLRAVWDETTAMLGSGVANILDVFNPALVVLGGGVTKPATSCLSPSAKRPCARRWRRPGVRRHRPGRARRDPRRRERGDVAFDACRSPASRRREGPAGRTRRPAAQLQEHLAVASRFERCSRVAELTERMCAAFDAGGRRLHVRQRRLRGRRPAFGRGADRPLSARAATAAGRRLDGRPLGRDLHRQRLRLRGGLRATGRGAGRPHGRRHRLHHQRPVRQRDRWPRCRARSRSDDRPIRWPAMAGRPASTRTSRSSCPRT